MSEESIYTENGEITRAEAARRLHTARVAAGWKSLYSAARSMNLPVTMLQDYEKGRVLPQWPKLLRIARDLHLDPEILFPELYAQTKTGEEEMP
jgi:transcriptional regulator with XRE-family HTH domain